MLHLYARDKKTGNRRRRPVCGSPAILAATTSAPPLYWTPKGYKPEENDNVPARPLCPACSRWRRSQ